MMSGSGREATVRLTMGQALVKYLEAQQSERDGESRRLVPAIFGIFGHGNVTGLGQALHEVGANLPYYQCRNEQSMVHTAAGFAKANRRLATLACTTSIGPGATNMLTGAALATVNRLPVLLLPGDYYGTRRQGMVLQQLEHPISFDVSVNDCFRPVSRFFDRITRPEQLLASLPEAMRILTDPAETGAVTLALPQDIQSHACDYPTSFFARRVWHVERRAPEPRRIEEAVALLREAKRPMIIAGGGVAYSQAEKELLEFAESFGIPVSETNAGKGVVTTSTPLLLGGQGTNGTPAAGTIARRADLVICVGTRLTDFHTASHSAFQAPNVRFVSINVCGRDAYKLGAVPIVADAREALRALAKAASAAGVRPNKAYVDEVSKVTAGWRDQVRDQVFQDTPGKPMSLGQVVGAVNEAAKPGDTIVAAAGFAPGDVLKLWDASGGCSAHIEFGYSCMGYEIPAGLGVRLAQPKGEVFVLVGDGTYLMNPSELVTAHQEGLKVTLVIVENHGFFSIRGLQLARAGHQFGNEFRTRDSGTKRLEGEYVDIDFAKSAEGFGARVWRVSTAEALRQALAEARQERRSCAIVVETDGSIRPPDSGLWWDFEVAEVSQDPVVRQLREQYERDREAQRFFY
jgi:3D-(3,5/4)-trihydroxycyclohexane-1,2-dione acylhydrolase (decyclizing)